jgi:hypothetical protein
MTGVQVTYVVLLGGMLLTGAIWVIGQFKQTAWAKAHSSAERIADIADDICSAGLAFLTANPTANIHGLAQWAVSELKASAPELINDAGSLASNQALSFMVNRKLVSAAQAAPLSSATNAVIAALAPSAATARIAPSQIAAIGAAVAPAAGDIETIVENAIDKYFATKVNDTLTAKADPTPDPNKPSIPVHVTGTTGTVTPGS